MSLSSILAAARHCGARSAAFGLWPLAVAAQVVAAPVAPGTLDAAFDPGNGMHGTDGSVRAILPLPDGKILIGGQFERVGGVARRGLARLEADGSVDHSFALPSGIDDAIFAEFYEPPFPTAAVHALVRQTNGDVVVAGRFTQFNGETRKGLVRLRPDGSTDASFTANVVDAAGAQSAQVRALAVQSDGLILVGGAFDQVNGLPRLSLARLRPDGALDSSFAPALSAGAVIHAILVQPDGGIVIGGEFTEVNGKPAHHVARLLPNSVLDDSFHLGVGPDQAVRVLANDTHGRILVGGSFRNFDLAPHTGLVRLTPTGNLDSSFALGNALSAAASSDPVVSAVAVRPDGRIAVGGEFWSTGLEFRQDLVLLEENGALRPEPFAYGDRPVQALAVQTNGGLVVGGDIFSPSDWRRSGVARVTPQGELDPNFTPGSGLDGSVYSLAAQPDGKVVVGGIFRSYGRTRRPGLARLEANGSLDPAFAPTVPCRSVSLVRRRLDGGFVVAAQFPDPLQTVRTSLVVLNGNGSSNENVTVPTFTQADIVDMRLHTDDSLVVVGRLRIGDSNLANVVRLDAAGNLVSKTLISTALQPVSLALEPDGTALVLGAYELDEEFSEPRVYRVRPDGSVDPGFNISMEPYRSGQLYRFCRLTDGRLLLGGVYLDEFGRTNFRLRRYLPDGAADPSFQPQNEDHGFLLPGPDGNAYAAQLEVVRLGGDGEIDGTFRSDFATIQIEAGEADGSSGLWLGGHFQSIGSVPRGYVARLHSGEAAEGPPLLQRSPYAQIVTWGEPLKLEALFSARPSAVYYWHHNGQLDETSTSGTRWVTAVTGADAGQYYVIASNLFGTASSAVADVFVRSTPMVTLDSRPHVATVGENVELKALVYGRPPLVIQWQRDEVSIAGANQPTLTLPGLFVEDSGRYTVTVSNSVNVARAEASLTVVLPFRLEIGLSTPAFPFLNIIGSPYAGFYLQQTADLSHWTTVGPYELGASTSLVLPVFNDSQRSRFFRVKLRQ